MGGSGEEGRKKFMTMTDIADIGSIFARFNGDLPILQTAETII